MKPGNPLIPCVGSFSSPDRDNRRDQKVLVCLPKVTGNERGNFQSLVTTQAESNHRHLDQLPSVVQHDNRYSSLNHVASLTICLYSEETIFFYNAVAQG